jgi:polysaccharide export outer membrane protein
MIEVLLRYARRPALWAAVLLGMMITGITRPAHAEDYVIGNEDVVSVSVWLHPELERSVAVNADGNVTLPPVGDIKAAGLTSKQLSDKIADRLSSYLRQTTTVTVTVTQYLSHSVFISGAVSKPGRYGFERIPTIVDVLGQAGGALTGADLSNVQIIRKEGAQRRTLNADISASLRTGDTSGLPALQPGDAIVIAATANGASASAGEGVAVLGEVSKPGLYAVAANQDIWAVLASAGGLTAHGRLDDVRLLTHAEGGQTVTTLDLKAVLTKGSRSPVVVKPGDVVVVMPQGASVWAGLVNVMALSRDALNVVVLLDYFNNRSTTK